MIDSNLQLCAPGMEFESKIRCKCLDALVKSASNLDSFDEPFPSVWFGSDIVCDSLGILWVGNGWDLLVEPKKILVHEVVPAILVLSSDFDESEQIVWAVKQKLGKKYLSRQASEQWGQLGFCNWPRQDHRT